MILETGALVGSAHILRASRVSLEAAVDFLKNSTGKTSVSAPPEAARVMLGAIAVDAGAAAVESTALITASILSKKLAAGLQGLLMDVKTGNGAFAASHAEAHILARSLVQVACGTDLPTRAWITDMNQVLGRSCGNAADAAPRSGRALDLGRMVHATEQWAPSGYGCRGCVGGLV